MQGKIASSIFLGVCLILAVLLIIKFIPTELGGGIFALALLIPGGMSGGFRKK